MERERERIDSTPRRANVCAATGEAFKTGDKVVSILFEESGEIKRLDIKASATQVKKLPEKMLARWTSRVKNESERAQREKLAPNDALVALFDALADRPEKEALRYALALLLTRRRVFRLETDGCDENANDVLALYSQRTETMRRVRVVPMTRAKADEVQEELLALLDAPLVALEKEGGSLGSAESAEITAYSLATSEVERIAEETAKALGAV